MNTNGSDSIRKFFNKRKSIIILQGIIIILLVGVIFVQNFPKYELLVEDIDKESMILLTTKLDEFNFSYKKEDNSILVNKNDIMKAKMIIAVSTDVNAPEFTWSNVFSDTINND